ncbi:hypothetical protein BVI2075_430089 [Burkholderia vietnamiensis]|nr:hypothetical protein BVI2075_430089 [Burkholderia vietnamiensis]CAG9215499.1 hypothetical protein BVI1335_270021 [Burkholderia vietnamiensis]
MRCSMRAQRRAPARSGGARQAIREPYLVGTQRSPLVIHSRIRCTCRLRSRQRAMCIDPISFAPESQ